MTSTGAALLLLVVPLALLPESYLVGATFPCQPPSSVCSCERTKTGKLRASCVPQWNQQLPQMNPRIEYLDIRCQYTDTGCRLYASAGYPPIPNLWFQKMPNLTHISIEGCGYNRFPPFVFANLSRLTNLHLKALPIRQIDASALLNSYKLQQLILAKLPCLDSFGPNLLAGMIRLEHIRLTRMKLQGVQVRFLIQPVKGSLRKFTWNMNHMKVTIPTTCFEGFNIRELDLSSNQLTDLIFLEGLTSVRRLNLEGNMNLQYSFDFSRCRRLNVLKHLNLKSMGIRRIPVNSFRYFTRLRTLILSNNMLKTISGVHFKRCRKLRKLDLSSNQLQTLPPDMETLVGRKGSFTLILNNNQLHCNCELAWLLKYPRIIRHLNCATAARPALAQKSLVDLRLMDLTCTKPESPIIDVKRYAPIKNINGTQSGASSYNMRQVERRKLKSNGSVTLDVGERLTLRCSSSGDPPPRMIWHLVNGPSMDQSPSLNHAQRYNAIVWNFNHKDIEFDRYVIVCLARSTAGIGALSVTVYNKSPKKRLPPLPRQRRPAASPSVTTSPTIREIIHAPADVAAYNGTSFPGSGNMHRPAFGLWASALAVLLLVLSGSQHC